MSGRRSTSLADRLAKMASTSDEETSEGAEEAAAEKPAAKSVERPLKVAPVPADAEDDVLDKAPTGPEAADPTDAAVDEQTRDQPVDPPEAAAPTDEPAGEGRGPVQTARVLASERALSTPAHEDDPEITPSEPGPSEPEPVAEKPAPRRRKVATESTATSTSGSTDEAARPAETATSAALGLHHLAATMERGRNQRRWVEDNLPHRSERGTFMRLPVHLLDVLDEYCDRRDLPQQDFVAAVLDSYFRDLGALPPLGAGNHPDERFFTEMRRQQRSRDY